MVSYSVIEDLISQICDLIEADSSVLDASIIDRLEMIQAIPFRDIQDIPTLSGLKKELEAIAREMSDKRFATLIKNRRS